MKNLTLRILGIGFAVFPFACVAISGGRTEGEAGAEATAGGAIGTTTTSTAEPGTAPDPTTVYGVEHASPYPCATNTAAYYDEPPLADPAAGCKDIYNSELSYPAGCTRTIVAPTAPNGASCVAYDCWCSGTTKRWEPSNSNFCW